MVQNLIAYSYFMLSHSMDNECVQERIELSSMSQRLKF